MPPKILISTALTFLSLRRISKACVTCSAFAPPPTSRKFAGMPPAYLMMSMATLDITKYAGGMPANFQDVGGGGNAEQVRPPFYVPMEDKTGRAGLRNICD